MSNRFKTLPIIYTILFLTVLAFSVYKSFYAYNWIKPIADKDLGNIANSIFVRPSICTHNTGIFLTICYSNEKLMPIEDIGCGDLGYPLLANIITFLRLKDSPLSKEDLVKVNIWINWFGLLFLAVALIMAKLKWSALPIIVAGTHYFMQEQELSADYYSTFWGIFCLALGGIIYLCMSFNKKNHSLRFVYLLVSVLTFLLSLLMREPFGYIGIIASFFVMLIYFIKEKSNFKSKSLKYIYVSLLLLSITLVPSALLTLRNMIWNVPKGEVIAKHGLSYSLVMTLGSLQNPWGLTRNDPTMINMRKNIDPNVVHYSNKHFKILRSLYIKMLLDKPREVADIYYTMLLGILNSSNFCKITTFGNYLKILFGMVIFIFISLKARFNDNFFMLLALSIGCLLALSQGIFAGATYYSKTAEIGFIAIILISVEMLFLNLKNWRFLHGTKG